MAFKIEITEPAKQDIEKAIKYYKKGIELKCGESAYQLAELYKIEE